MSVSTVLPNLDGLNSLTAGDGCEDMGDSVKEEELRCH